MKLELRKVITLNQLLRSIIDDDKQKIDALFKFKLLGIMKSIESHVENFELIKIEKIKEYGKKLKMVTFLFQKMIKNLLKNFQMIWIKF